MKVIGIDPGLRVTGYGLIECHSSHFQNIRVLEAGIIKPRPRESLQNRIAKIYKNLEDILRQFVPETAVVEKLYSHYKHPITACTLGHVRGVILLMCARQHLHLVEHSVKRIRKTLVGNGNATKQQTREVVAEILGINAGQLPLDASDALALALGHVRMQRLGGAQNMSCGV